MSREVFVDSYDITDDPWTPGLVRMRADLSDGRSYRLRWGHPAAKILARKFSDREPVVPGEIWARPS